MRKLRADAGVPHRVRIQIAFTAFAFLLASSVSFATQAKNKFDKNAVLNSPTRKAALLNFPPLPKELAERIEGKSFEHPMTSAASYDSSLAHDWPLVNIGFFQAFTPLVQPAKSTIDRCSSKVIVAVVDTGIDYTHPELRDHIWVNPGESGKWEPPASIASLTKCRNKGCNGIDDDSNGYVDDVFGWDFPNEQPYAYDVHGHGTHIAGIISSEPAANVGMVGVCPDVTIMPLKYYDNSGLGYNNLQNTVRAIRYAIKMGANIINYSGGGADPAASERAAIEEAQKKGILFVAAAGNDGHDNNMVPYYPASYGLDNIISVASLNRENDLLPSSNFGSKAVNIGAPGLSIMSDLPGGRFGTMSGTSQATAFVTGAAALLASQFKDGAEFDYRKVKRWILEGAKPMPNGDHHRVLTAGILSVSKSLDMERDEMSKKVPVAIRTDIALKPRKSISSTQ